MEISYVDLADRLTSDALQLFCEMVDVHLEAGSGRRVFLQSDSMQGSHLVFGSKSIRKDWTNIDPGALQDLAGYGLLHLDFGARGSKNYRVSGEALHFHQWLMEQRGTAITQVEAQVQTAIAGEDFARAHPSAAHHLNEAFALLWGGETDPSTLSEIGDHLRKALMDTTSDLVGQDGGKQESPIPRLTAMLKAGGQVSGREADVLAQLVELARVVLRLDHRLNHIRDEVDKGEPPPTWDETRRAAFTTAFVSYELGRLPPRSP